MKSTLITVPTKMRYSWLHSRKHNSFQFITEHPYEIWLAEDDAEIEKYRKRYTEKPSVNIYAAHSFSCDAYDMLIDIAYKRGFEYLYIFDDDLSLSYMNNTLTKKLIGIKNIDMLVEHCNSILCEQIPLMSLPYSFERIGISRLINFTGKMMNCYFIHIPTFIKYGFKFTPNDRRIDDICDLNINLTLLRDGFFTARLCSFFTGSNKKNNPGGCSIKRTPEWCNTGAELFHAKFPTYTYLKVREDGEKWISCKFKKAFNRAAFEKRFGIDANKFAVEVLKNYYQLYNASFMGVENGNT